jgi:hypothetical protein
MEINVQGAVTSLYFDVFPGWKQTFYLGSDHHYDSVHCNRALLTQHLEQMKDENALGLFVGDWFDAMQGRFDPRRSMEELRPEFRTDKYYDVVVKDSADYLKPYASNILVMARGNHECVDPETEVLTCAGWKPIAQVTMEDEVFSIHPTDLTGHFARPLKIHTYPYVGTMYHVTHSHVDMLVTPNHRIAFFPQKAHYLHYHTAEEMFTAVKGAIKIPTSAVVEYPDYNISDDEIRFTAWILTDGQLSEKEMAIYQSKPTMVDRIRELLTRLGYKFSERSAQRHVESIRGVPLKSEPLPHFTFRILRESHDEIKHFIARKKLLPDWIFKLSKRQFDIFLEELILGDGSVHKHCKTAKMLYGEKPILEDVQRACTQYGYRALLSSRNRNGEHSYWILNIVERENITIEKKDFELVPYDGTVHCLTTPSGNFMARRNGKVYLTGNSAVIKNAGTDLLDRLTEKLRMAGGITRTGGYGGWIRLMFNMSDGQNTGPRTSIKLKYFHGSGGDAPVTKGVIWTNRQATYLPDADIVVNGHNHNSYIVPIARERLSNKGVQYSDIQYHVRTPGYKQDYGDGSGGWAVEKGMPPKPVGCAWITLICRNNCIEIQPRTDIQGPEMMPSILSEDRGPIFEYAEP